MRTSHLLLGLSILLAAVFAVVTAYSLRTLRERPPALPPLLQSAKQDDDIRMPVADFELTERSGKAVKRTDLAGKVWVASFVFTCCTESCPRISGSMASLQHDLQEEKDVRLVSFSVNPASDTPAQLKVYADNYQADPERWLFLTGKQEDVYRLIQESFHLAVEQNRGEKRTPGNEVMHSNKLALVDRQGRIRGYFDGTDEAELARLRARIKQVLGEK